MRPARLRPADVVLVGSAGLRTRPLRVFLSALGISIGIAAMLAVVGLSASSGEDLDRTLARLGTNLLTVAPGQSVFGADSQLDPSAVGMVSRIESVESVGATGLVEGASVYRNRFIPADQTNSLAVLAVREGLPATTGSTVADGSWLNQASGRYPAVVLGAAASRRLGIDTAGRDVQVWLGGRPFSVIGILDPVPLAAELDAAALIGWDAAVGYLHFDGHPTRIYARTDPDTVRAVQTRLAATANPAHPEQVKVSRPSDVLVARQATDATFTTLLLGLGAVALLVGGVGVANTMVISVLERRAEIGLRRSLGATRGQIRLQFLVESQLLSGLGGGGGIVLGSLVTAAYAGLQGWPTVVPAWATVGGFAATLLIGGIAGLYPAVRAARLSPTEALAAA